MTMLLPTQGSTPDKVNRANVALTKLEAHLLSRATPTFASYYNGKMSYAIYGKQWEDYVARAYPELKKQQTSENIFKTVIDLYAENLVPVPQELRGFSNVLIPLLSRGECPVDVDKAGVAHFPEHYEMVSDGKYTCAAIFTRSLEKMEDYVVFVTSDGKARTFAKAVPDDLAPTERKDYKFVEEETGHTLFRFALDDKGFGASLAALQDRLNHSIIDQTIVAEMYARPFWYLMNVELPQKNPYLPNQETPEAMAESELPGAGGRIFTTSGDGPFGQLDPPTIADMIAYHDSIVDKTPQSFGVPAHYLKPGSGTPPTGVALKVLSKRFNNKVNRMREDIEPQLEELAKLLNVPMTGTDKDSEGKETKKYEFWPEGDDLLQESLDAHGLSLAQMGYPLPYIAEVVTPGVDLDDYADDADGAPVDKSQLGQPTDMTATGQQGLVATPGQVASYGANPGQRAKA